MRRSVHFLSGLAALPTLIAFGAHAMSEGASELSGVERVLSKLTKSDSVLINITAGDMPSSPDILHLGRRTRPALERCLADNADAYIRVRCAQILQALGDPAALPALRSALEDWDARVRQRAIRALGAIPHPDSHAALAKLYLRKDEKSYNKTAALASMGALGSHASVKLLRKELRQKPKKNASDRRATAFRSLWRSRHLMARATLASDVSYALGTDYDGLTLAAAEVSAELRERSLVGKLIPLLEHKSSSIRNKSVYALGKIGDKRAATALLKAMPKVREARMLNNIAFALERLDKKAFYPAIQKLIAHKQGVIRLNAAYVIGDVKHPEGLPYLKKALTDPSDYVRTSAVVALGKLGTSDAAAPLRQYVDDPNTTIRQEAIYALHQLSGGKERDLIYDKLFASKYAKSSRGWAMRRRAALALGRAGDKRARKYLVRCFEQGSCTYRGVQTFIEKDKSSRTQGRMLLAWANGRYELTRLLGQKQPKGTLQVATSAFDAAMAGGDRWRAARSMDLLGEVGNAGSRQQLENHLSQRDTSLRMRAAVAAARLGSTQSDQTILSTLDQAPAAWLAALARIVSAITEPEAQKRLEPELKKRSKGSDIELAMASAAVLLAWEPDAGFFRFLDGLSSKKLRERELSARYLKRNRSKKLTSVMRRALARESRAYTRDRLRALLDRR